MTATGAVWRNWARTEQARPLRVERPRTTAAVQRAVRAAGGSGIPIKAVGSGHSFTGIAVATGVQLALDDLTGLIDRPTADGRASFYAGTRLRDIPRLLAPFGLAMNNLGDIDGQSISGAISTGTHGTGAPYGGLADQVRGVTIITGDGELLHIDEDDNADLLPAVALGLGALGILAEVTIACVPRFLLESVEQAEPLADVLDSLAERAASADHFEFFWFPHTATALTKTNTRLPGSAARKPLPFAKRWVDESLMANGVYRATCFVGTILPPVIPVLNRLAAKAARRRRFTDVSHRVFSTKRTVRFREMEYALPAENVPTVIREIEALIAQRRWRISFPIEVRFAAADSLWLSTAYGRDTGYVAVHRYIHENPARYFAAVEAILIEHGGRPHWGKMHTLGAGDLRALYPRFDDFLAVRDRLDPRRLFSNPYLTRVLGP
ncbi:D-arabinono-1,4-lactone oxidase [Mycetocola miduiensis]|uniref:FAD-linked oxidoreductase n=1 Tax=Mycetocola miduiensis TaxID=995034 RepID=A0A1I5DGS2_9MICO|nr:D-arabinono-1,4-lactone oxidase [Mycetocola miduiensis]SFN97991.1 FAD-linked oxidoreductase [Mycetocola miduiensis]